MKKEEKDLTQKAVKKELRGYYYAGVHQYEGECDEDKFVDIVYCDQYGVSYESCYDGWDYIIRKVPDYEDVCSMESQVQRLQKQLKEANEVIKEIYDRTLNSDWSKESNKLFDISNKYIEKWGLV